MALGYALSALEPGVALAGRGRVGRQGQGRGAKAARARAIDLDRDLDRDGAAGSKLGPARGATGGVVDEHVHVRRGDTLAAVLAARGVPAAEARAWLAAAATVYDLRRLQPRHGVSLRFERSTHALAAIRYEIDDRSLLVLERTPRGVLARRATLPYFTEVKGAAGRIERGLREDAIEAGIPPRIVSELADIFGWELDLTNDLRAGDEFRILYENLWQAGDTEGEAGKVLGAEIVARGRAVTAVFFEDADGRGGYYAPNGDSLSREFLRYPVEFTEISSEFSLLRRHPILRRERPHLGVDFAAPTGTPVRAVANGTVAFQGWANRLGRCVRIDHANAIGSTYGHLAGIASGITAGRAVDRGQVIGYVGASGLATGPHLHFALEHDGRHVDPLSLPALPETRIPAPARREFERVQAAVVRELSLLPRTARPLSVSLSDAPVRRE
jgi:murein DD-endopeptidase MepM/ murein hydrolase activator NlpD